LLSADAIFAGGLPFRTAGFRSGSFAKSGCGFVLARGLPLVSSAMLRLGLAVGRFDGLATGSVSSIVAGGAEAAVSAGTQALLAALSTGLSGGQRQDR
jgi:hypothetical protein